MRGRLRWILLVVSAAMAATASAEPPIPFDGDGHVLFRKGAACGVKVELFLDLACSDCAVAWPIILQAADEFSRGAEFIFRLFPLPYHSNAFTAAKAAQVVKQYSVDDEGAVEAFAQEVFERQMQILNSATADMAQSEIQAIFAKWAETAAGVTNYQFQSGMADSSLEQKTRYQFKYGCLHTVYGTPIVRVGGIFADSLSSGSTSLSTWRDVLDPLVPATLVNRRSYYREDGAMVTLPWAGTEEAPCS